jgi:hypothetical protein
MFRKRISDLGVEDVAQLLREQWPESFNLEFKSEIPTEDGKPDRWITHHDRIGRVGSAKILKEIVAFANAHGGTLDQRFLGSNHIRPRPQVCRTKYG